MNFADYIGVGPDEFTTRYLETGLVQVHHHHEFPLSIYNYGRKAVHENIWDNVTSRCRGIIVNRETGDIVARPFEKFHNYGSENVPQGQFTSEPTVWEKVDGFMCTAYSWEGKNYIASKGSFHSIHAKWATAEFNRKIVEGGYSPEGGPMLEGWTFVFEGLHKDLRIVVDYGDTNQLVLLACINNETGEEKNPQWLHTMAGYLKMRAPRRARMTLAEAHDETGRTDGPSGVGEEGFVATWYRQGMTPFRLKLKFVEYLRIHRMVTGVSPKRIWEALAMNGVGLDEYLNQSTPWFAKFTKKWVKVLRAEFARIEHESSTIYTAARETVRVKVGQTPYVNLGEERKAWATEFTRPENKEFSSVLFAMLDNKDVSSVIWKKVRYMTAGANPMVDAHNT